MGLNCRDCDAQMQRERGCKTEGIIPFYIGTEKYKRCPISLIDNLTWEYIRAYNFYKKNMLPNGTSWLGESDKYLNAMAIIDVEVSKLEREKLNKKGPQHGKSKTRGNIRAKR